MLLRRQVIGLTFTPAEKLWMPIMLQFVKLS
jgi:hypothetical protein